MTVKPIKKRSLDLFSLVGLLSSGDGTEGIKI